MKIHQKSKKKEEELFRPFALSQGLRNEGFTFPHPLTNGRATAKTTAAAVAPTGVLGRRRRRNSTI
jgi:hypothetical protein